MQKRRQLTEDEINLWNLISVSIKPISNMLVKPSENRLPIYKNFRTYTPILDLHGCSLQEAYHNVHDHLEVSVHNKVDYVTIVTGKSGVIHKEFPEWLKSISINYKIQTKNNGGSWIIKFKRC